MDHRRVCLACPSLEKTHRKKKILDVGHPHIQLLGDKASTAEVKMNTILWAPHWTSALTTPQFVSFIETFEVLRNAAAAGKDIWYRPHPLLHEYLAANFPETSRSTFDILNSTFKNVADVPEIDLICSAELLIHNSGSFIAEWALTGKPSIFVTNDSYIYENLNPWDSALLMGSTLTASDGLADVLESESYAANEMPEIQDRVRSLLKTTIAGQPAETIKSLIADL